MKFEWDKAKNRANIERHGIDFADAHEMFEGPLIVGPDTRFDYGEERWIGVGIITNRVVVGVFTETDEEDTIRIISVRKALKHERRNYEKTIANRLESR